MVSRVINEVSEKELAEAIKNSFHKDEALKAAGVGYINSRTSRLFWFRVEDENHDVSHFRTSKQKTPSKVLKKHCKNCEKPFVTMAGSDGSDFCKRRCRQKYFSGRNNPQWKEEVYRTTCFEDHDKVCVVCGETNTIEVHHYDKNHDNNNIENLIPLCPTHHKYMHIKRCTSLIQGIVDKYREDFIASRNKL